MVPTCDEIFHTCKRGASQAVGQLIVVAVCAASCRDEEPCEERLICRGVVGKHAALRRVAAAAL